MSTNRLFGHDAQSKSMNKGCIDIPASQADWQRERKAFFSWDPGRSLLCSIRSYQRNMRSYNPLRRVLLKRLAVVRHLFWSAVCGADIPLNTRIGGGLLLPHPNGIVIHPDTTIGPNCLIFQQVTIGTRSGLGPPVLGAHLDVGAGAKILGNLTIGDHACIGANAVVLHDVPAGKSAVGIPAKVLD